MPSKHPGAALAVALAALAGAVAAPAALIAQAAPAALTAQDAPPVATGTTTELAAPAPSEPPAAMGHTDASAAGDRLERETLIAAVLALNPGVEAARQALAAARERVPQATALEDPMASYSLAPLSIASDDVPFGQVLEARQRLPFPGKLRLRGEAAQAEAEAAEADLATVRLELAVAASVLYDDYYLVHRALAITAEHVRLLEDFQRIATARYAAGLAPQHAPIQAEVELAHLAHRQMSLETDREVVAARLNALLHRPPDAALGPPVERLPEPEPTAVPPGDLVAAAVASRPELIRLAAERGAREAVIELRELDRYPDFEAMASYSSMWMDTEHQWMVGVGVNVPLQRGRIRAGVAEARAEAARLESESARLTDEIGAEVAAAAARLRETQHILVLYHSRLIPAAHDQVRAALAGFETGQGSFLDLIEAERNQR
ncbi:MAG TPA: TolC family protein, partial [Thermoanaerobaculia bacterium]|nr:TolC family protein [Thermoanaerobaculia bacterium]